MNKKIHVVWGQIVIALMALASIRVYTELLSPMEFGKSMLFMGLLSLLDGLFVSSFNQLIAQRVSGKYHPITIYREIGVITNVWVIIPAVLCIMAFPLLLTAYFFYRIEFIYVCFPIICIFYIVTGLVKSSYIVRLNVIENHLSFSKWSILESVISFIIVTIFLIFYSNWIAFIFAVVLSRLVLSFFIIKKQTKKLICNQFKMIVNKNSNISFNQSSILKYGLPILLMGGIGWLSSFADRYILNAAGGADAVAVYVAVVGLISRPYNIVSAMTTSILRPKLYRAKHDGLNKKMFNVFIVWVGVSIIIGIAGIIFGNFFGSIIVKLLLAEGYRENSKEIITILSYGFLAVILTHAVDNWYLSKGKSKALIIPQIMAILIGCLFIYFGAVNFGDIGAAYGRTATDVVKLILTTAMVFFGGVFCDREKLWKKNESRYCNND